MHQLAILSLLLTGGSGQASQVPYAPGTDGPGPTFSSRQVLYPYPGSYSSIRAVDFPNLRFLTLDDAAKPRGSLPLKNGHYKLKKAFSHESVDLDSVHHLDKSSALALYSWFSAGGSSSQAGIARVFSLSGDRLRVVQEIEWDKHFEAGQPTESFDPATNTLVIRSAHYIPGDAHCCVSAMDVVTFRWDGAQFVQTAVRTELSEYGKSQGKTLPKALPR